MEKDSEKTISETSLAVPNEPIDPEKKDVDQPEVQTVQEKGKIPNHSDEDMTMSTKETSRDDATATTSEKGVISDSSYSRTCENNAEKLKLICAALALTDCEARDGSSNDTRDSDSSDDPTTVTADRDSSTSKSTASIDNADTSHQQSNDSNNDSGPSTEMSPSAPVGANSNQTGPKLKRGLIENSKDDHSEPQAKLFKSSDNQVISVGMEEPGISKSKMMDSSDECTKIDKEKDSITSTGSGTLNPGEQSSVSAENNGPSHMDTSEPAKNNSGCSVHNSLDQHTQQSATCIRTRSSCNNAAVDTGSLNSTVSSVSNDVNAGPSHSVTSKASNIVSPRCNNIQPRAVNKESTKMNTSVTTEETPDSLGWSHKEKKLLLDILQSDTGTFNWKKAEKRIKSKTPSQIKKYTETLMMAQGDDIPLIFHAEGNKTSLKEWTDICEHERIGHDDIDAKCLPQLLTIAAMERTSQPTVPSSMGPNFCRIYNYLSCILKGETPADISAIDAKVVLELIHCLEAKLMHSDYNIQMTFIRNKHNMMVHDIMQGQRKTAIEQLHKIIGIDGQEIANARQASQEAKGKDAKAKKNTLEPTRRSNRQRPEKPQNVAMPQLSSLNPINVPVHLLMCKPRAQTTTENASKVN